MLFPAPHDPASGWFPVLYPQRSTSNNETHLTKAQLVKLKFHVCICVCFSQKTQMASYSNVESGQNSEKSTHSHTPSALLPTPVETDAAVPLEAPSVAVPPTATDTSITVLQSMGNSCLPVTPNAPHAQDASQVYTAQGQDSNRAYTHQDETQVHTSQSQGNPMNASKSHFESNNQCTNSLGNPAHNSEHSYPPSSSSDDSHSNSSYPLPHSSNESSQNWGSYTQQESQHKQGSYSNEYSYSNETNYDYNRGSEYYEGYKRDYSSSYDQTRGWNKGDYQYGYSDATYHHQQGAEYKSDPNYGQQQSNPNHSQQQSDPNYSQQKSDADYSQQHSDPNYGQQHSDPIYSQQQSNPNYGQQQSDPNYGQQQSSPIYGQQQSGSSYSQQQLDPSYGQQQSDSNYSQQQPGSNYNQQQSDPKYSQYSGPNHNQQQSDPQHQPSGDYNQQPTSGSGYDPHRGYSQGNYSYQGSYGPHGYDSYPQSYKYDSSYYQEKPYYGDSGEQHSYPDDRNYSRYSRQYDSYYDQGRPHQQHHHDEHSYRKDPRGPSNVDTQVKLESKGSDAFVQRRSAMFRRAEIQQVSKNSSRSSRGPQIVQPHRLAETSDSKKNDKSKQPESLFPKRNLDSFKIPKKKNASSAPSPVKKTIPIPALDNKIETQTEQVKSSPLKVSDKKLDAPTSEISPVSLLPQTNVLSTAKPTDVIATASSSTSVSSVPPPVTTMKKKQSSTKPRTTTASQKTASAKKAAPPTVLSTLDPKALLSLAVTLQKTLEQASAQKNAAKLSNSSESVSTSSPLLASSSVTPTSTSVATAPITVAAPSVASTPPAVTSSSLSAASQALLVPNMSSRSVVLNPPIPMSSSHSPMPLPDELPPTFSSTFPASIAVCLVTATPSLMATSSITTVAETTEPLAVTSIASSIQATPVVSSPLPVEPPVQPTSTASSAAGSSAGVVLATVISSTTTSQLKPESSNTSVTFSQSNNNVAPVSAKSISQMTISSLSSLVNAICSATAQNKGFSATGSSSKTTVSQQHTDLNQQAVSIKQESKNENVRKRSRSPDIKDFPLNKKLKSEDECQSNTTTTSSVSVSSFYGKADKLQSELPPDFLENKERSSVNGQPLESKLSSNVKDRSTSRRKSTSKSKMKVHASKHIPRSSSKIACCLCHKLDSEHNLGFLFGPYEPKAMVASFDNKSVVEKSEETTGLWIHEDCAVWTPGICLVGGQLLGIQEAVTEANKMVCTKCKESGATLCCGTHNCRKYYHCHCARELNCFFDDDKYLIMCPKHSNKSTA